MSKETRKQKVISKGMIDGIKYYIVKNGLYNPMSKKWGCWYCAYIEPPVELEKKDPEEDINVYPHGGITFRGYLPILKNRELVWGWDYNHSQDITWNTENFLETKLQVIEETIGIDRVIDIITKEIEEYIGGVLDEISH